MKTSTKTLLCCIICAVIVIGLILLGVLFFGHPLGEKEYLEDLNIEVPGLNGTIIVKEWRYLLGSGEDIYYVAENSKKPKLIGKLTGGNDGYCPFADGKYSVSYENGELLFSWAFTNTSESYNRSDTIALPGEK